MIAGLFDGGAVPVLERVVQFTHSRHRVITDNIANLSTPYYKPRDLDPGQFQEALADAIERRRGESQGAGGPLRLRDTDQLEFEPGRINTKAQPTNASVLFHDQNNRDVERIMQDLAENTLVHSAAIEMIRNEFSMIATAIRERV